MTLIHNLHTRQQRLWRWLFNHRPFGWLDGLTSEYGNWKPDPPIWERLIR